MDTVSYYVKGLFRGVEDTDEVKDQKAELESHIKDHMSDLTAAGLPEQEAFEKTIAGLGDLDELIDTITGRKVRVRTYRVYFLEMLAGFLYGIAYICSVGTYLYRSGTGIGALYISLAGFSGYVIPFIIFLVKYLRKPNHTAAVTVRKHADILVPVTGWLITSAVCWIMNFLLIYTVPGHVYTTWWAWMPTAGVFTWPLMTFAEHMFFLSEARRQE
jgi:hypothetical protein